MIDSFEIPIIFIVFNRPHQTRRVFEAIAAVRPQTLLVVADGHRSDRPGEAAICAEVRAITLAVNWPCTLHTEFADTNLGCDTRVISGLDWAFSLVDEAIILEDDCLPDPSFFPYCSELLGRYRGDGRIAAISGTNLIQDPVWEGDAEGTASPDSYLFSLLGGNWGWATWRTQWQKLDRQMQGWPALHRTRAIEQIFDNPLGRKMWTRIFDQAHRDVTLSSWDYSWAYTNMFGHRLTAVPRVNLGRNLGFGVGASRTIEVDRRLMPELRSLELPLQHPAGIVWSRSYDELLQKTLSHGIVLRILNRIKRMQARVTRFGR
jgi:hypothetical protein